MQTTKGVNWIDPNGIERNLDDELGTINFYLAHLRSLDSIVWGTLDAIAQQGMAAEMFRVGDEKRITLTTGEVVTAVILGFEHDDLTAGGKAKITFGMRDLMATNRQMNPTSTNVGGWDASAMRNTHLPLILSQLPADLQAIIKPVDKLTSSGGASGSTMVTSSDSLFLMSGVEVNNTASVLAGEGTTYPFYVGAVNATRVKRMSDGAGAAAWWWSRSPTADNASNFRAVNSNGVVSNFIAVFADGVSFCFCI